MAKRKTIILIIVLVAIIASIVYLESIKPKEQTGARQEISIQEVGSQTGNNDGRSNATAAKNNERVLQKAMSYPKAIELVSPDGYVNTAPFNLSQYIGKKVILIDFWTYSCINCQRTLPYLISWDKKYHDKGLLIVGVHSPEFDFEKDQTNVERAVQKYGVTYPVVLDNEHQTWNAYQNEYWPHEYLIDIDGFMVHDHIGEGDYEESEQEIQKLLDERAQVLGLNTSPDVTLTPENNSIVGPLTPEIYLGYAFQRGQIGNAEGWKAEQTVTYAAPASRQQDLFYLDGNWKNNQDNMQAAGSSKLFLTYTASSVNIVAGSDNGSALTAIVDGKKSAFNVSMQDLYQVAAGQYGTHNLEIDVPAGVKVFTFTFG